MPITPTTKTFDKALQRAIKKVGSDNRLAGHLDVSRQAVLVWRNRRSMPLLRAMQVAKLTGVDWRHLSPESHTALENTATLD